MASPTKSEKIGSYVRKVGYFDIRQKIVQPKKKKNFKGQWESTGGSVEINLYHGKNKIGGPYKSHQKAEEAAKVLISENYKYKKQKR